MIKILKSWQGIVLSTLFLFVFFYVGERAYLVSFSHDEALSFRIINGDEALKETANHHILNSWLMSFCNSLFGSSEFSLRLPNFFGMLLFFFGMMRVLFSVSKKNLPLMILIFSITLFNPYVLDFFALARGYGLGLSFGMISLSYFIVNKPRTIEKQNSKAFKVLGFMLLAVYANLTYINYFLLFLVLTGIDYYHLFSKIENGFKDIDIRYYLYRIAGIVVAVVPAFLFLFHLKNNGQLYFGGEQGIIENSVSPLIHRSIYFSYYGEKFWKDIRFVMLAVVTAGFLYHFIQNKYQRFSKMLVIIIAYFFILNIQFYWMGARFPQTRTALFLIPIFAVFLYYFLNELMVRTKKWLFYTIAVLGVFLSGSMAYHFSQSMNFETTKEWDYDGGTKAANKLYHELKEEDSTISYDWLFGPAWEYYEFNFHENLDEVPKHSRKGIIKGTDFVYCFQKNQKELIETGEYKVVKEFKIPKTALLQKVKD